MYQHILVATDGSERAMRAVEHSVALASKLGAKLTVLTVTRMWNAMEMAQEARLGHRNAPEEFERKAQTEAKDILARAEKTALAAGVVCASVHIPDQSPGKGIIETAEAQHCDLIVMASHGRGKVGQLILGSHVNDVLSHSNVPMLVVH